MQTLYRTYVLRKAWMALAKVQCRVDARLNSLLFARKLRRVAADVEALVRNVQTVGSPFVLVMEIVPPGWRWRSWMPGLPERTAFINAELESAVHRVDLPNVKFVRTVDVLAERLDPDEEATPDGGHYSARAHRIVGEWLSREILEWADTQTHLKVAAPPRARRNRAG